MRDETLCCAVIYISVVEIPKVPNLMWHKRNDKIPVTYAKCISSTALFIGL